MDVGWALDAGGQQLTDVGGQLCDEVTSLARGQRPCTGHGVNGHAAVQHDAVATERDGHRETAVLDADALAAERDHLTTLVSSLHGAILAGLDLDVREPVEGGLDGSGQGIVASGQRADDLVEVVDPLGEPRIAVLLKMHGGVLRWAHVVS